MGALGGGKHSLFFTLLVKNCVWAAVMHLFVFPRAHGVDLWLSKPRVAEIRNGVDISYLSFFFMWKNSHIDQLRSGENSFFSKGKKEV